MGTMFTVKRMTAADADEKVAYANAVAGETNFLPFDKDGYHNSQFFFCSLAFPSLLVLLRIL